MNNNNTQKISALKSIYTKDKNVKITFRCDDTLSAWLKSHSQVVGLTPSALVRQIVYQNFYAEQTLGKLVKESVSTATAANNANN